MASHPVIYQIVSLSFFNSGSFFKGQHKKVFADVFITNLIDQFLVSI